MLDLIDVHDPFRLRNRIDDAIVTNSVPIVGMESPLETFDLRSCERGALEGVDAGLNRRFNGGLELLVLPHRMR